MSDLWALTAAELVGLFEAREATALEALASVLDRVEAVNPRLNAVVTLDREGAGRAAEAATRRAVAGRRLGPLDGVPVTVKDNLFVGGVRATWGSLLFADHVAERDDLPVAALRAAGAVIVGKTNTPELSLSGYTDNRVFGPTGNPWAPDLSPGGSSGGAVAAVASGCGPLALATDAGGSIRRPAAHTGVVGLKPGLGRVARRHGFPPLAHDLQAIGPVARCVADLRAMFAAIAGPGTPPLTGSRVLRIGVLASIGEVLVEPAISAAFSTSCAALRDLGHAVEPIPAPWDPDEVSALFAALSAVGVARVMASRAGWQDKVTPAIRAAAEAGAVRRAAHYVADLDRLAAFRWRVRDAMAPYDVVATPASPALAWPKTEPGPTVIAGRAAGPRDASCFSTAINLAGLPALVLPMRMPNGVLPAGLQLVGRVGAEELLIDLAERLEVLHPWPRLAPL